MAAVGEDGGRVTSTDTNDPPAFASCVPQADGSYFVDVNSAWLSIILDYLAHGIVTAPEFKVAVVAGVQAAADYLGLYSLSAECGVRLARAAATEESVNSALRELTMRVARVEAAAAQATPQPFFLRAAASPHSNLVPMLGERFFS